MKRMKFTQWLFSTAFVVVLFGAVHITSNVIGGNEADGGCTLAFIGAIVQAASGIASGIFGAVRANKQRKAIQRRQRRLDRWRNAEMDASYLDRADSRDMIKQIRDTYDDISRKQQTHNIKGGASDEAMIAQAGKNTMGIASASSRVLAQGQKHKDQVQSQYEQQTQRNNEKLEQLRGKGTQAIMNAVTGSASKMGGLADELWQEHKEKKENQQNQEDYGIY